MLYPFSTINFLSLVIVVLLVLPLVLITLQIFHKKNALTLLSQATVILTFVQLKNNFIIKTQIRSFFIFPTLNFNLF
jgi:hypothetical protein